MKTQLIFKYIGMGIIAMLLAMCEAGVTPTDTKTYTFSYETTPQGTAATLSPTWNRDVANATYAIDYDTPAGAVIAPTIDATTGTVSIAIDTTAGSYTISATSADTFTETATAKVYVTVAPTPDTSADSTSTDPAEQAKVTGKAALTTAIDTGIAVWGNEGDFNYIITTAVTAMNKLFYDADTTDGTGYQLFNGDIRKWDTSAVTNMSQMFQGATSFNQPIGNWNTSKVENMSFMFGLTTKFNQPIGDWNTSKVEDMSSMFYKATAFNQPIGDWNTSKVKYMNGMFGFAALFDQPIGDWNTSAVKVIEDMFLTATEFNQNIDSWNVGAVDNGRSVGVFTDSGMKRDPCWYDSSADGGKGAIIDPRPADCAVAFAYDISTYTLSYETTPQGTATTLSPTWNKAVSNATYEISHDTPVGTVTAPTIDESTGEVTIATGTTAGSYTITATGKGSYSGTATAKVYVTVAPAPDPSADSTSTDPAEQAKVTGKAALTTAINAGINTWGNEGDFNYIITTAVTDMSNLFEDTDTIDNVGYQLFNGDISKWDTSAVTNMTLMFQGATSFNQPIGDWNTSAVQYMNKMFYQARAFNQPIGNWNTSAVQNMSNMFNNATSFNQPIGNWNTSAVQNMQGMFAGATEFNQSILTVIDPAEDGNEVGNTDDDRWNTSKVQNMFAMFYEATSFNQKIDNWNVGAVQANQDSRMFIDSGMKSIPCWYNSSGGSDGNGAIRASRPADCLVAD